MLVFKRDFSLAMPPGLVLSPRSDNVRCALGSDRRPVAIDLFSGAGGLSLGFEQAGFDILAAVEYDPIHAAVHSYNFPCCQIMCADISVLGRGDFVEAARAGWNAHRKRGEWDGQLDAVIGGPPCQGFSVIGRRQADDARNRLVFDFARVVGELQPRCFIMENVPGLVTYTREDGTPLIDLLIAEFASYGYSVRAPRVLNACEWGVPQDRRRLIIMGALESKAVPAYPVPVTRPRGRRPPESLDGHGRATDADETPLCPTVWDAIGDLPDLDLFDSLLYGDEVDLTPQLIASMHAAASRYARVLLGLDQEADDLSRPRIWTREVLTSSARTVHQVDVRQRFGVTDEGRPEPVSRLFRLHRECVSCTLRAGTHYERGSFNAPRPIHPILPRVISVREAARLHSFPDWFRLHWTKWHGFREVGNALPPKVGRAVGREVTRALGLKPRRGRRVVSLGDSRLLTLENLEAAELFGADQARIPRNALRTRRSQPSQVSSLT